MALSACNLLQDTLLAALLAMEFIFNLPFHLESHIGILSRVWTLHRGIGCSLMDQSTLQLRSKFIQLAIRTKSKVNQF